jgi:hypothetical protein
MSVTPRAALTLLATLLITGCGDSDPSGPPEGELVQAVQILAHPDTLIARSMLQLQITATDALGDTVPGVVPVWESSDTGIARVDPDGWLRGRNPGVVKVWARAGDGVDSTTVQVLPAVYSISLAASDSFVGPGGAIQYTATLRDSLGNVLIGRRVDWRSTDTRIARIDSTGAARLLVLDSTIVVAESGPAMAMAWARGAASFRWVQAVGTGLCAGLTTGGTACTWEGADVGSGSPCDLSYDAGGTMKCRALHALAPAFDSVYPMTWAREHTCSLRGGAATCWGYSTGADLPFVGNSVKVGPHQLPGLPALDEFATGYQHACGRAGTMVWCWGAGNDGNVGRPGCTNWSTPCGPGPVAGVPALGIAVGERTSCAITTDRSVACWGYLGLDTITSQWITSTTPVVIDSVTNASQLAFTIEGYTTCALTLTGEVWCWGRNGNRELGHGGPPQANTPERVAGLPALVSVVGGTSSFCGLDGSSKVWCWGFAGYTGWNTPISNTVPCGSGGLCRIAPAQLNPSLSFTSLSAGTVHTCGMATDGIAYCWGRGWYTGVLGDAAARVPGQRP